MSAHQTVERFERVSELAEELARQAALVVAVLAGFLAVTSFLANQATTKVVTNETEAADLSSRLEANMVKTDVATSSAQILEVTAIGTPAAEKAAKRAEALDARIEKHFEPIDEELRHEISAHEHRRADAEDRHLLLELSSIGFEVGIVLAGISIIARRRWLLGLGGALGIAGLGVLIAGLLA